MPNLTTNFEFNKPLVNNAADADLWGGQLNDNWEAIDTSIAFTPSAETASFSVVFGEFNYTYIIDSSAGAVVASLPAAADAFDGFVVRFYVTDATETITLTPDGSETISGQSDLVMGTVGQMVELTLDVTNTDWKMSAFAPEAGTEGQALVSNGDGFTSSFQRVVFDYAKFQDEKASGTDGGASIASSWLARTLNTEVVNGIAGASLASNTVTLDAGDYEMRASAPALASNGHKIRLRDTTNSVTLAIGPNSYSTGGGNEGNVAALGAQFTLADTSDVQLQYYLNNARSGNGLGQDSSSGDSEIYAVLEIWKIG